LIVHDISNRIQRGPFRLRPRHVAAPYALMLEGVEYRNSLLHHLTQL
jgi:hypothetical protein